MDDDMKMFFGAISALTEAFRNLAERVIAVEKSQEDQRIALGAFLLQQKQAPVQEEE